MSVHNSAAPTRRASEGPLAYASGWYRVTLGHLGFSLKREAAKRVSRSQSVSSGASSFPVNHPRLNWGGVFMNSTRFALAGLVLAMATLMVRGQDAAQKPVRPQVEVVFCLDTTGSMGGLIDAAKKK